MNILDRLAPTIGGVLGGIGGEVVDPFGGGIAGAALGSGIGKGIQNASQGQSAFQGNDITAGIEGGLGQGAGDLVGGALGAVGGALGKFGTKTADAAKTVDEFGALKPAEREGMNLNDSLSLADQLGIPKTAHDFATAPDVATGANGVLNGTLDGIVTKASQETGHGIDLSGYGDVVKNAIKERPELGSLEPTTGGAGGVPKATGTAARLQTNLNGMLQQFGYDNAGSLTGEAAPDTALNLLRKVGDLKRSFDGSITTPGQAQASVYKNVEDFLKDKIYNNPDVKQAISNYKTTPEDQAMILKAAGGNEKYAQALTDTLDNATSSSDITGLQSKLIDMREAGKSAMSHNAAVLPGEEPSMAGEGAQALGHAASGDKGSLIAQGIRSVKNPNITAPVASKMGNLLDRMSPFTGKADDVANTGILDKVPGAMGASLGSSMASVQGQPGAPMQPSQPGQPQGMPPLLNQYDTMMGMMTLDPYLSSSLASPLSQLAPEAQKLSSAQSLLPQVEQDAQGNAGQGLMGGALSGLLGKLGIGQGAAYQKEAANLQSLLAQLGLPSAVPGLTSSPGAVPMQFNALNNSLNSAPSLLGQMQ